MKAEDPSIKIGVSVETYPGFVNAMLANAGANIDFFTYSLYPPYNMNYSDYAASNPNLLKSITDIYSQIAAFDAANNANYRNTIKLLVAEFNSLDWSYARWDFNNNLGHGLMNFEIIGEILKNDFVIGGNYWGTRYDSFRAQDSTWFGEYEIYAGLNEYNQLTAVTWPLAIWNQFLKDANSLVSASRTTRLLSYSSFDSSTGKLNIYLMNKGFSAETVSVDITSNFSYSSGKVYRFSGTSQNDKNPEWTQITGIQLMGNNIDTLTLPSTSITVISLAP
jgi:hypothetical protein